MSDIERTLRHEVEALRNRLEEAEDILRAIQSDQVDAVVVYTSGGDRVFSLKHAEEPYRLFVEKIQEGTVTLSTEGVVLYANQPFTRLVGHNADKIVGADIRSFFPSESRDSVTALLAASETGGESARTETTMLSRGEELTPVYLSASRYQLDSTHGGICLIVTDRSEQKRIEEMTEKLRHSERLASIGTLATGIAHEINNPLNAILLSAQYAMDIDPRLDPEVRESIKTIVQETQRCGRIVRNVLAFAKREEMRSSAQDLNASLRHAAQLASSYTGSRRLNILFDLAAQSPVALFNPMEIEQVVVNLIRNACEAGGEGVQVTIGSRIDGAEAEFWVKDNGPGIAPQNVQRLFDPFFSTRREQGGTGLGLSIVHGIVTKHGGRIDVSSEPGAGACFVIHLPLAQTAETERCLSRRRSWRESARSAGEASSIERRKDASSASA
jgi:PAS domain S-box-containing protein